MKVFAFGNEAIGFIAIGNVAIGFIAIGNIAIGVVSFGFAVTAGAVAIGGNPVGIVAIGAGIALGIVFARSVGVAVAWNAKAVGSPISLRPRDRRPPVLVGVPPLVDLGWFASRVVDEGWARVEVHVRPGGVTTLRSGRVEVQIASPDFPLPPGPAIVQLRRETRAGEATGYRDASTEEVLVCMARLDPPPKTPFRETTAAFWIEAVLRMGPYLALFGWGVWAAYDALR